MFVNFNDTFREPFAKVKLSETSPCDNCDVTRQLEDYKAEIFPHTISYLVYDMVNSKRREIGLCEHCGQHAIWIANCIQKLQWYEDRDKRLKDK